MSLDLIASEQMKFIICSFTFVSWFHGLNVFNFFIIFLSIRYCVLAKESSFKCNIIPKQFDMPLKFTPRCYFVRLNNSNGSQFLLDHNIRKIQVLYSCNEYQGYYNENWESFHVDTHFEKGNEPLFLVTGWWLEKT